MHSWLESPKTPRLMHTIYGATTNTYWYQGTYVRKNTAITAVHFGVHTINAQTSASARLKAAQSHFINGERVESTDRMDVLDPGTGKPISTVCLGGQAEIDAAVSAARAAFPSWAATPADERTQILLRFAALIEANGEEIKQLSILDGGLANMIGDSTAWVSALFLRYYAGWTSKIAGQTLPSSPNGLAPTDVLAYTLREPIGVVGAITPWNYPYGMEILKIAPVLAAGCSLVLKPAEETPLASLHMAELALEAGIPPGVFNVVNGRGEEAGAALASHPDVDKVAFTGSTDVGRIIVNASAGNLKKVSLELGGKSPVFVFPDAKMEQTIPGVAMAGFMMSGQNCVCGSRLYVHESVADEVANGIAEFAKTLTVGHGNDPANMIGPLISERQRDRVNGMVKRATEAGAEAVTGGEPMSGDGWFVKPTLFRGCTPDMELTKNEVFGPVIAMQTFSDDDDYASLAAMANDSRYGLSGSVWTQNLETAMRMTKLIDSGQVGVNTHAAMDPSMPFGGNKESGWGREFGEAAMDLYTKTKAVTVAWA
ncbi:MAG: aldehyde dehydrogenase [Woeseiaceae bacterium]